MIQCGGRNAIEASECSIVEVLAGDPTIYRIGLPGVAPGFRDFITPWVIVEKAAGRNIILDPGPAATIPELVRALERAHVEDVHYVLLTHAHIDHMGGLGKFLERYRGARVLAMAKSHPHLVDPSRLMQASLQTLGDLARAYGPIAPVPAVRLLPEDARVEGFDVTETPGHAPHHLSFVYHAPRQKILFSGEAAGIYSNDPAGGGRDATEAAREPACMPAPRRPADEIEPPYIRPATPPRFFYEVHVGSLESLNRLDVSMICYAHSGFSEEPHRLMNLHLDQLRLWRTIVADVLRTEGPVEDRPTGRMLETASGRLLREDRLLSQFSLFDNDIKRREQFFIENAIQGFWGYLQRAGV